MDDWMTTATKLLPCGAMACCTDGHALFCPARYRSDVAEALKAAYREGIDGERAAARTGF